MIKKSTIPQGAEILKIDGESVSNLSSEAVFQKLKGLQPGEAVEMRKKTNIRPPVFGLFLLGLNHAFSFIACYMLSVAYYHNTLRWYRAKDCNSTDLGYMTRNESRIFYNDERFSPINNSSSLGNITSTQLPSHSNNADYQSLLSNLKHDALYFSSGESALMDMAVREGCVSDGFSWLSETPSWLVDLTSFSKTLPLFRFQIVTYYLAGLYTWLLYYARTTFRVSDEITSYHDAKKRAWWAKIARKYPQGWFVTRKRWWARDTLQTEVKKGKVMNLLYEGHLGVIEKVVKREINTEAFEGNPELRKEMEKREAETSKNPIFQKLVVMVEARFPRLFRFRALLIYIFLNIPMMAYSGVPYATGCEPLFITNSSSLNVTNNSSISTNNSTNSGNSSSHNHDSSSLVNRSRTSVALKNIWDCEQESLMDRGAFQVDKATYVVFLFMFLQGLAFIVLRVFMCCWKCCCSEGETDKKWSNRYLKFVVAVWASILFAAAICGIARMVKGLSIYDAEAYLRALTGGNFGFFRGKIFDETPSPLDEIENLSVVLWLQGLTSVMFVFKTLYL